MFITEYRIVGANILDQRSVERAVYPYLGPERTPTDVDQARASLEKAYRDKGYSTVVVTIPEQKVKQGVVLLQVTEMPVGRLRVNGSRYHDLERLKQRAPSLAEGTVPNFNTVNKEMVALNSSAGLRVTPTLRAGVLPGTVDIDLTVQDELPLHGSLELNNRYNANTTPWRLSGSLSYTNLWQKGHVIGANFQIAPERLDDALVYSGYYMAPLPGHETWSLTLQGTKQDSDVSTLGGAAVAGRGDIIGLRLGGQLPQKPGFYHSISFGIDYKDFDQDLIVAGTTLSSPVTYFPFSLNYSAAWAARKRSTELNTAIVFHVPEFGSDTQQFNTSRFRANDGFAYLRGDLSHTQELGGGVKAFAKVQGQLSSGPLISNEQLSGGGLSTVRGYLESTALGDNGLFGTFELRSPSLLKATGEGQTEWRFHIFADAGYLTLDSPLPGQQADFALASAGVGTRFRLFDHLSGTVDMGVPLIRQGVTDLGEVLFTIRFLADF
jgi:hemolysin activation/secretion protein